MTRPSTFGGEWRRPDHSGRGRSMRELQDRASFDVAPAAGVSCMTALVTILLAALATILGVTL